RRVFDRDAFAFDSIAAGCGRIEQQINEVVFEQIHLVNVEEAAIGAREQPRLERSDAFAYGALKIDRAAYAILRRVQRQLDDRHMRAHTRQTPLDLQTRATIRAQA